MSCLSFSFFLIFIFVMVSAALLWIKVETSNVCFVLKFIRVPGLSLFGRWNWFRHGNTAHFEDQRRVSRQNDAHILCFPIPKGV